MQRIKINGRPGNRDDLASWYASALEEQAASGLSVAEYAGQLGVTPATLYQWRRRLGAQGTAEQDRPAPFGLVEVVPDGAATTDGTEATFVVRLGRERGIEVPREFDDVELRRLVRVLESC